MDISTWLRSLDLERYETAFRANDIDMQMLPQLTADDLKDIGVSSVGHRCRLLSAAAALRTAPSPAGTQTSASDRAGAAISSAPAFTDAERRQLTVMFCDLVGSTHLATRMDPEDLSDIVRTYQNCCREIFENLGGHVARYLGDGVLACFGYPIAHGDDAGRAVRAGMDLVDAVKSLPSDNGAFLQVRIGIATGIVVVGDLAGPRGTDEGAVIGVTPNLAARLQVMAAPGSVLVSDGTRKLAGPVFDFEYIGEHLLKGFSGPILAWRVLGERKAASRFEALRPATLPPIIGRDREMSLLVNLWQWAKGGQGQVALLSGDAGIGKSRLACALLERLAGETHAFRRCQCSPLRQDSPLFPIAAHLEREAGLEQSDGLDTKLRKLTAILSGPGHSGVRDQSDQASLIADLLAIPSSSRKPDPEQSPQRRKERLLDLLAAYLTDEGSGVPVLILFEDAHWSDPTSLDLMSLVIERIRHLPVLMIVTFRPEFRPPWTSLPGVTTFALGDLGRNDAIALAERIAGDKVLPDNVVDAIVNHADGVPLFVEEMTRAVVESDWHEPDADGAGTQAPLPLCAVPSTLYSSLLARLDRLGPAKEIAQIGAVIGRDFTFELLKPVAQWDDDDLGDALDRLVATGLVFRRGVPPHATFSFKHALIQEAAYATLLRSSRRELHGRVARTLETLLSDVGGAYPELLAHHCALADMVERSALYWGKAGRQAIERSAMAEASGHLRRALERLPDLPDTPERRRLELDLQTALGTALSTTKGYTDPATGEAFNSARVLCERLNDMTRLVPISDGQCLYHILRGEMDAAQAVAESLMSKVENGENPGAKGTAHRLVGLAAL
jgi:class 3 adenylate cyclase